MVIKFVNSEGDAFSRIKYINYKSGLGHDMHSYMAGKLTLPTRCIKIHIKKFSRKK